MIKYARINHCFDAAQMRADVRSLEAELWKPHYNTKQYEGGWATLPLRAINGNTDIHTSVHASAQPKNMTYMDTSFLKTCAYLPAVINFFQCGKMSVRLMKLDPGAVIKEHTDHEMSFEDGEARFHIPVVTNRHVNFFIEDEKIVMGEGECWYLNLSLKHRVSNLGEASRIHLVIDCKVNDWIKDLLNNDAAFKKEISVKHEEIPYSEADKSKIIHELRLLGTRVSNELADKLEQDK